MSLMEWLYTERKRNSAEISKLLGLELLGLLCVMLV